MSALTPEQMRADVAAVLKIAIDEVGAGDFLPDLGLDSIRAMMLLQRWLSDSRASFSAFAEDPTINGWWRIIEAMRTGQ
ncbi:MAG: phosphopantetheine-binding protein [Gemmatimonas sp.]